MTLIVRVNGKEEQLQAATVADLLSARGIVRAKGVAVALNGAVVPAGLWATSRLASGDQVEIVKPFGGG